MKNVEMQGLIELKACFQWLKSNKRVKDENSKQGRRKRHLNEGSKMWLPKEVVNLMQILYVEKLKFGSKIIKLLKMKKNKS